MTALAPNLWHAQAGWQRHNGAACPVNELAICRFQFRCGHLSLRDYPAHQFRWSHRDEPFDIVAFQVVEVPEEAK